MALGAAVLLFLQAGRLLSLSWPVLYLAYVVLDWRRLPQSRLAKWIRNTSPVVFLVVAGPALLRALGAPPVTAGAALVAVLAGALFPYLYERRQRAMTFLRGMVLAFALEGAAQCLWPSAVGPQAALPLYAALFALGARTVFWRYSAPILFLYAVGAPLLLGWSVGLALHYAAALLAAGSALALRYRLRPRTASSVRTLAPTGPIE